MAFDPEKGEQNSQWQYQQQQPPQYPTVDQSPFHYAQAGSEGYVYPPQSTACGSVQDRFGIWIWDLERKQVAGKLSPELKLFSQIQYPVQKASSVV
ncbi:hypothetical protein R1flu_019354 [Riccia fluitans]|uniref:Uncharacterized protein n=1 Tax=Riccia fluitans TaxID=41844 RepID=A0ABD1ZIE5_9MARC